MDVVVIGGGVGGCAAARRLATDGHDVVLIERGGELGGLVGSLTVGGTPIERYYHHVFPHERDVVSLIDDLGLTDRLAWCASTVGVLRDGRVWPFTSPVDLLRFGPLPPADRLRAGVGALRLSRSRSWDGLDEIPAERWLAEACGDTVVDVIWRPLLESKFGAAAPTVPAAWMWGRLQQRSGARQRGGERLGYLRGGFRQVFDRLDADLRRLGVELRFGQSVDAIRVERGRATGVRIGDDELEADAVLFAGTLPALAGLLPPETHEPTWLAAEGMGVICAVVELARPVTDVYWTNVCDPTLGFGAWIEHTNLVPAGDYGGQHLAYIGRYFTADEPLAREDPSVVVDRWLAELEATGIGFRRGDVDAVHVSRANYAAPLVRLGHLDRIPQAASTTVDRLFVATTAQIYPQDRGMSEGVRLGDDVARMLTRAVGTAPALSIGCPVCGTRERRSRWPMPAEGTEGGVDADAFRPSAERYGTAVADIVRCCRCGHAYVEALPPERAVADAYAGSADPVSLREEQGQEATADRDLELVEEWLAPGPMVDVGCWTGSLLVAAKRRGWQGVGIEPSKWACERARERGVDVRGDDLFTADLPEAGFRLVTFCDVLEHLVDPGAALAEAGRLLEPGGGVFATVPDAGSLLARAMGRRWWSVLPMHLQYFTRRSFVRLLGQHGFTPLHIGTHAKRFSARYYAERLGGYSPALARGAEAVLGRAGFAERLVGPDFRDRLAVVAIRTG